MFLVMRFRPALRPKQFLIQRVLGFLTRQTGLESSRLPQPNREVQIRGVMPSSSIRGAVLRSRDFLHYVDVYVILLHTSRNAVKARQLL